MCKEQELQLYILFLLSQLAVKRDIAVTILLSVYVCIHSGHKSFIYAWVSKLFYLIVVLEEEILRSAICNMFYLAWMKSRAYALPLASASASIFRLKFF